MSKLEDPSRKIHPAVAFFLSEWHVIKSVSFYIAVGLVAIAINWFWESHYKGTIQEKDARIDRISEERDAANRENGKLTKQVDGLRIYREQDGLPLKKKALILAHQIKDFIKDWKDTDNPNVASENIEKYLKRFGLRAQIIRDDLDQNGQQSGEFDKVMYNFSMNYQDVRTIGDQIEKLANKLPD